MDPVLQQKLDHLPGDYVSDFPMASCMNTRPVEQDSKATPMPLEIHAEQHASFFYLDVHFLDGAPLNLAGIGIDTSTSRSFYSIG